jgi:hypothetical protein
MRSLSVLALFAAATSVLAADLPDCPQKCVDNNPTSSWCDGDEKGQDLDDCTCASYFGSLMVQCIMKCPDKDQSAFKATLPKSCRDGVMPDVDVDEDAEDNSDDSDGDSDDASTTAGTNESATSDPAPEPTVSGDSGDEDDAAAGLPPPTLLAAAAVFVGLLL